MNRTTKPIAKCLSILLLITLFACHTNKESAIELFEYGRIMEERMQPDSAVVMYQRAIKQSMASKDTKLIGLIYNQLGDLYLSHYLFNKSLLSYQSGLKYNQLFLDKINASKSLRGIGKSYTYRSMPDSGLIYLSQALQLSESINDKEEVVRIHNNISNAYFELEQFDEALKHNIQALNMTKDSTSKYINSFARADIMYQLQKYDSAQYY
ncbi:tetratricopeptide repeat protein, partial [Bacteroides nordii]